ncbi:hypothetical protein D6829_00720 [Candidatus Pacearchaeota archaeon]|nr:MAG: hypothetical protein D6829_00720 [Candidatus Pacearchaeota archaeon]
MVMRALSGLLDEKLVKIISLFVRYPEKKFYLSEVSKLSGVNNTSTFRILNRLVAQEIIKPTVIGRVRVYQLAKSEKAYQLAKIIKSEEKIDVLDLFVNRVKIMPRVRKIILDSRVGNVAKLIIVSDFSLKERINRVCKEIYEDKGFKVEFVELNPSQFEGLKNLNSFKSEKKVLFKRE